MEYILSIDQSTSATKAFLWDEAGRQIAQASLPHRQIVNERGWIEHDALEIYRNVLSTSRSVIQKAGVNPAHVRTIGLSNQRETAVCWDAQTGLPVCHAIVWQCARAAELVREIEKEGVAKYVHEKTGLPLSPFFSAAKICWIIRHVPQARDALANGRLRTGTMDAWLIFKLTGGCYTDYSNASRTQLLNLDTLTWDDELLEIFGLQRDCLPAILMSDGEFGSTDMEGIFPHPIPIHAVLGDSHAALFANRCLETGMAKATFGTGASIMINAGNRRPENVDELAVSLAWGMRSNVNYVFEGNVNYAGSVIKWLCEKVEMLESPDKAGAVAQSIPNTQGVYLVPAFSGLGAPWFRDDVRAAFMGINRTTTRAHFIRAAEECIAYQVADVVQAANQAIGTSLTHIFVDGGAARDTFLMQFQADILGIPIYVSETANCSAAGAAACAALAQGICSNDVFQPQYHTFSPQMPQSLRSELYDGWKMAVISLLYNKGECI